MRKATREEVIKVSLEDDSKVKMMAVVASLGIDSNGNKFSPEALQHMAERLNSKLYPIVYGIKSDRKIGESSGGHVTDGKLYFEGTVESSYLDRSFLAPCVTISEPVVFSKGEMIKSCEPKYFFPCSDHSSKDATLMKAIEQGKEETQQKGGDEDVVEG